MARKKTEGNGKTMDVILIILGIFLLAFVGVMIYLYRVTGGIPDTLVTCVFAICGCECGVMGWIKNCKEKYKERQWQVEDAKKRK